MRTLKNTILACLLLVAVNMFAQQQEEAIDASKPTNFYSFLDNTLEYTSNPAGNVMGYRGNLTLAPSESHLILAEVPIQYNLKTEKAGIGDLRARYFWLPYKNYDKLLGAFGPSVDVFAPTGNYNHGIGSGSWIVSPGLTTGLMIADWIQVFPIVSYQYTSANRFLSSEISNKEQHGITLQAIVPVVLSDKFFVQITPIYRMNNIKDERQDRFVQEVFASYAVSEKIMATAYFNGNFKDDIYTSRIGLTTYF